MSNDTKQTPKAYSEMKADGLFTPKELWTKFRVVPTLELVEQPYKNNGTQTLIIHTPDGYKNIGQAADKDTVLVLMDEGYKFAHRNSMVATRPDVIIIDPSDYDTNATISEITKQNQALASYKIKEGILSNRFPKYLGTQKEQAKAKLAAYIRSKEADKRIQNTLEEYKLTKDTAVKAAEDKNQTLSPELEERAQTLENFFRRPTQTLRTDPDLVVMEEIDADTEVEFDEESLEIIHGANWREVTKALGSTFSLTDNISDEELVETVESSKDINAIKQAPEQPVFKPYNKTIIQTKKNDLPLESNKKNINKVAPKTPHHSMNNTMQEKTIIKKESDTRPLENTQPHPLAPERLPFSNDGSESYQDRVGILLNQYFAEHGRSDFIADEFLNYYIQHGPQPNSKDEWNKALHLELEKQILEPHISGTTLSEMDAVDQNLVKTFMSDVLKSYLHNSHYNFDDLDSNTSVMLSQFELKSLIEDKMDGANENQQLALPVDWYACALEIYCDKYEPKYKAPEVTIVDEVSERYEKNLNAIEEKLAQRKQEKLEIDKENFVLESKFTDQELKALDDMLTESGPSSDSEEYIDVNDLNLEDFSDEISFS